MTISFSPLLRLAAACAQRAVQTASMRFAVVVAIVVAAMGSAHAAEFTTTAVPGIGHAAFEVRVAGTGPDVLLIPGLATSGAVWDDTVRQLATHYRCHVFTLNGFAGVPRKQGPSYLTQIDVALAAYIEDHHLAAPAVVGHSLGGFVALRLAMNHPQDVGRLVLVDALPALGAARDDSLNAGQLFAYAQDMRPPLRAQTPARFAAAQASQIRGMVTAPADAEKVIAWAGLSDRMAVIDAMVDMLGSDLRPGLDRIRAPTLVMGSWIAYKDVSTMEQTRAIYERQYKTLGGVQIVMSPAGRHFIMLDDPAWFESTLEAFLEQPQATGLRRES